MTTAPDRLCIQIRRLLDRLVNSRRLSNDEQEAVGDEVAAAARALPREGVLEALDKAIGSSEKRREEAVFILSELTNIPEAVNRIGEWLHDPNPQCRSWLIQTVKQRGLKRLAPLLNDIIENDPDSFCRDVAIHAAGTLKADENLPILLRLAERGDSDLTWRLAWALKDYSTEECRPYLKKWFENEESQSTRVIAAWGLGKLGHKKAIAFLIRMLDDPDVKGPNFSNPGQSLRAAQALCDIHDWPFEGDKPTVLAKTRDLVRQAGLTRG
jgi:HEAT repeat protein